MSQGPWDSPRRSNGLRENVPIFFMISVSIAHFWGEIGVVRHVYGASCSCNVFYGSEYATNKELIAPKR